MTTDETVAALVAAARSGDNEAWGRLVDRYAPLVCSVARRYRLDPDEVKDISATLWLRLVEHLDQIREPRALPGWIVTTTRNEALRFLRSRNRIRPVDPQNVAEFEGEDQSEVDDQLLQAERRQALRDALEELRPHHRELLLLLLVDPPLSYDEISRQTGHPQGEHRSDPRTVSRTTATDGGAACVRQQGRIGQGQELRTMDPTWDRSDDDLMGELKEALEEARSVPPDVMEAAKAAFTWRTVDEELEMLTLAYDSAMADVGVRGVGSPERMLVFEGSDLTLEVEVNDDVLMGQVVPALPGRVILQNPQGSLHETEADDGGFFLFRRPASSPVRFKWIGAEIRVVTAWLPI